MVIAILLHKIRILLLEHQGHRNSDKSFGSRGNRYCSCTVSVTLECFDPSEGPEDVNALTFVALPRFKLSFPMRNKHVFSFATIITITILHMKCLHSRSIMVVLCSHLFRQKSGCFSAPGQWIKQIRQWSKDGARPLERRLR